jgi:hypothetical protein
MKTITINGWEYETETHDFGKKLLDIEIQKGWELWTKEDIGYFIANPSDAIKVRLMVIKNIFKDDWFYIKQWRKDYEGKYVAWFYASSGRAYLYCNSSPSSTYSSLGVRFKRKKIRDKK